MEAAQCEHTAVHHSSSNSLFPFFSPQQGKLAPRLPEPKAHCYHEEKRKHRDSTFPKSPGTLSAYQSHFPQVTTPPEMQSISKNNILLFKKKPLFSSVRQSVLIN